MVQFIVDISYLFYVDTGIMRTLPDIKLCNIWISEKRKQNFQQGVIKFIGNLDKQHDCYKLYVGIKLDEAGKRKE